MICFLKRCGKKSFLLTFCNNVYCGRRVVGMVYGERNTGGQQTCKAKSTESRALKHEREEIASYGEQTKEFLGNISREVFFSACLFVYPSWSQRKYYDDRY